MEKKILEQRRKQVLKALYMKEDTNMTRIYAAIQPFKLTLPN